jgi:hypothetical protein
MEAHIEAPPVYDRPQQPLPISEFDESEEWTYAWDRLTTMPPDDKQEVCPHCREVWHYPGERAATVDDGRDDPPSVPTRPSSAHEEPPLRAHPREPGVSAPAWLHVTPSALTCMW